jgi:cytoskeletal protein CcmA (bactofilin family)
MKPCRFRSPRTTHGAARGAFPQLQEASMGLIGNSGKKAASHPATAAGRMETVIGANTSIVGSIKSDGHMRIDGSFEGDIEVLGDLIVGATGRVIASIKADNIHVAGAVKGELHATSQLQIAHSGKVWGDITATALQIEPGGVFRGQSAMDDTDEPLLLEAPKPA